MTWKRPRDTGLLRKVNLISSATYMAAKPNVDIGAAAAKARFVRTPTFQPAKMLHNARKSGSTGCTAALVVAAKVRLGPSMTMKALPTKGGKCEFSAATKPQGCADVS